MAQTPISDELWDAFHRDVNMSSRELREWLATDEAGETSEAYPDQAGEDRFRGVLEILTKRRTDLSEADVELIADVLHEIRTLRGTDEETRAGDAAWRHRLMSLGHDPLKPMQ